jgi:hypothetical protein
MSDVVARKQSEWQRMQDEAIAARRERTKNYRFIEIKPHVIRRRLDEAAHHGLYHPSLSIRRPPNG